MLPDWLGVKPANTEKYNEIKQTISSLGLNTVCVEAHCPNITECWSAGTATFMILGELCTRGCRFCAVSKSAKGVETDRLEPEKLAKVIKEWGLGYVVLTSVCRDDLPDQGAGHFAACVREIKKANPGTLVEVLIPDFRGDAVCLQQIVDARPDVIGHNMETVERLNPVIRDRRANYAQSLKVLQLSKSFDKRIYTKSAMMLGVGETEEEILKTLQDLRASGVDFLAMGQYLRPSQHQYEVKEYVALEKFERLKKKAMELGFLYVAAGPFIRSSYKAREYFIKALVKNR
jgi:lipoic acid synthetase